MNPLAYLSVFLTLTLVPVGCGVSSKCVTDHKNAGKITVTCPQAEQYLPGFPSFNDRDGFFNDSLLYKRGFAVRDSERGKRAVLDASLDFSFYLRRFGAVMEVNLSEDGTPSIAKYIKVTYEFARSGISTAKNTFARQRPYSYFQESSLIPEKESPNDEFKSYPSGHSVRAWAIVMALVAIDDIHYYEIIKAGLEICEGRIITGFHYASDVEAARVAASIAFAKIVSDPEYVILMREARLELESLR